MMARVETEELFSRTEEGSGELDGHLDESELSERESLADGSIYRTPGRDHSSDDRDANLQSQLVSMTRVMGDMVRVMQTLTEQHSVQSATQQGDVDSRITRSYNEQLETQTNVQHDSINNQREQVPTDWHGMQATAQHGGVDTQPRQSQVVWQDAWNTAQHRGASIQQRRAERHGIPSTAQQGVASVQHRQAYVNEHGVQAAAMQGGAGNHSNNMQISPEGEQSIFNSEPSIARGNNYQHQAMWQPYKRQIHRDLEAPNWSPTAMGPHAESMWAACNESGEPHRMPYYRRDDGYAVRVASRSPSRQPIRARDYQGGVPRRNNRWEGGYRRPPPFTGGKVSTFSGKEEWQTWISQFQAIARRYQWTEEEMLDQLLPRLEGAAAEFVFSQLPPAILDSYEDLVGELNSRFRVVETARSFAAKFSRRMQKPEESIEEYAADLKRLYDKAHGYRDRRSRDEDLVRKFLDGLRDEETRFEVEYHKEPHDIDEAVYYAVSLMQIRGNRNSERRGRYQFQTRRTYDRDGMSNQDNRPRANKPGNQPPAKRNGFKGQQSPDERGPGKGGSLDDHGENSIIKSLLSRIEKLEGKQGEGRSRNKRDVECFNCRRRGHYARECPEKQEGSRDNQQQYDSEPLNGSGPTLAAKGRSE